MDLVKIPVTSHNFAAVIAASTRFRRSKPSRNETLPPIFPHNLWAISMPNEPNREIILSFDQRITCDSRELSNRVIFWAEMMQIDCTRSSMPSPDVAEHETTSVRPASAYSDKAPRKSAAVRRAMSPISHFVTAIRSGTSMIPAFMYCNESPDPGWAQNIARSETDDTPVSD